MQRLIIIWRLAPPLGRPTAALGIGPKYAPGGGYWGGMADLKWGIPNPNTIKMIVIGLTFRGSIFLLYIYFLFCCFCGGRSGGLSFGRDFCQLVYANCVTLFGDLRVDLSCRFSISMSVAAIKIIYTFCGVSRVPDYPALW